VRFLFLFLFLYARIGIRSLVVESLGICGLFACEVGFEVAGILRMKGSFWLYARVCCFCSLCHARSLCSCRVVFALSGKNVNPTLFCDRFRVLTTRVVVVVVLRICRSILWAGTSRDLFRFTFA
jgi:hypothetical protein